MSELGNSQPKLLDPDLTPSQVAVRILSEEMLAFKPPEVLSTSITFGTSADPEDVQERLRQGPTGDLMLADGDTLSALKTSGYQPELGLFVGQAALTEVDVRAWAWTYDKSRIDPNGPEKPPYKVIRYPGEKDWVHRLDVVLRYSNDIHDASQSVTTYTSSMSAGETPLFSRDVRSQSYADMGYEGHNQKVRYETVDDEVLWFVNLMRELFEQRTND